MSLTFSAYHDFNEQFALMADVGWTNWSAFDYNVISFDGGGASIELARNFTPYSEDEMRDLEGLTATYYRDGAWFKFDW